MHYSLSHYTPRHNRAVGIEYVENPRIHPAPTEQITTARATRFVVVSSGALGSPAILERSGIGAKEVLEKAGVQQLVDVPGVGSEYQGKFDNASRNEKLDRGQIEQTICCSSHLSSPPPKPPRSTVLSEMRSPILRVRLFLVTTL